MMTLRLGVGGFVLFVVAGVEVGGEALELGGAGVDELEYGAEAVVLAESTDLFDAFGAGERPCVGQAFVGDPEALGFT
jgi:hypothetical protein